MTPHLPASSEIRRRLEACQTVLVEGVNSERLALLFRAYSLVDKRRGGELVTQARGLELGGLAARLVHADMAGAEFDQQWDNLPFGERLAHRVALPILFVYMLLVGPWRVLARHLQIDDLLSPDEAMLAATFPRRTSSSSTGATQSSVN